MDLLPRFVNTAFPETQYTSDVDNTCQLQSEYPSETVEELENRNHDVEVGAGTSGTAHMKRVDEDERLEVGVEPERLPPTATPGHSTPTERRLQNRSETIGRIYGTGT